MRGARFGRGIGPDSAEDRRKLRVALVGAGVVGFATGKGLLARGHDVIFCDVDNDRLATLRQLGFAATPPHHLPIAEADAHFICVPTPTHAGRTDLSFVKHAAATVAWAIANHPGWPLVVLRSTVPPGTTEGVVKPIIERVSGRRAGSEFGLCMNPEFLRAATADDDFANPRVIVVGALNERAASALEGIYKSWHGVPVVITDLRSAEAAKYVANVFNAVKISFFNEMLRILSAIGADSAAAFDAAVLGGPGFWDPRYGTVCGAPFGGACLPKDTAAFLGFAEDLGFGDLVPVLRAALRINEEMAGGGGRRSSNALPVGAQKGVASGLGRDGSSASTRGVPGYRE